MHIVEDTLDDALMVLFSRLLTGGTRTQSSNGPAKELIGCSIQITDPRARLSRSGGRSTIFSSLGETLWYLSGSNDLAMIEHYIPSYRKFAKLPDSAMVAPGAYGPRLHSSDMSQLTTIIRRLKSKRSKLERDTRRAVITIYGQSDLFRDEDIPCTCTLQFFPRSEALHLVTYMRSNDAYIGFPHDVFAFTFIQEFVACATGYELGTYHHMVGSLHIYENRWDAAGRYQDEGWHESLPMPPMPSDDPTGSLAWLIDQEKRLRHCPLSMVERPTKMENYWEDLARILKIYSLFNNEKYRAQATQEIGMLSFNSYKDQILARNRSIG